MNLKARIPVSTLVTAGIAVALMPQFASAQWGVLVSNITGCNFVTGNLTSACIPRFIGHLITFVYGFVGVFFILNVMYAGYQLAIAYIGESDKGAGKERLKWSIAGLILTTCIFLILDLVLKVVLG